MNAFELDQFLPYRLNVLAARVSRGFAAHYRERFGLSVAEWRVLAHLSQTDAVSVRDIHDRADLEKSKASRAAAKLEAAGLVTKTEAAEDRRLISLTLTDEGRALLSELIPIAESYESDLLASLPDEERAVLSRAIDRLMKAEA